MPEQPLSQDAILNATTVTIEPAPGIKAPADVAPSAPSSTLLVQTGQVSLTDSGSGASQAVVFPLSFTNAPSVTLGSHAQSKTIAVVSITVTGCTITGSGSGTWLVDWIAASPTG